MFLIKFNKHYTYITYCVSLLFV